MTGGHRLATRMSGDRKRSLHPLLLERSYWHHRLQELEVSRISLLLTPRPELSSTAVEVDEFRVRAHDGTRIWGLRGRRRIGNCCTQARVRLVGPSELPEIDRQAIERGEVEFIFQQPAGRRLEDRVMDVLRVWQIAAEAQGEDHCRVELVVGPDGPAPDEFLIASHLLADELRRKVPPAVALDDTAGYPAAN